MSISSMIKQSQFEVKLLRLLDLKGTAFPFVSTKPFTQATQHRVRLWQSTMKITQDIFLALALVNSATFASALSYTCPGDKGKTIIR